MHGHDRALGAHHRILSAMIKTWLLVDVAALLAPFSIACGSKFEGDATKGPHASGSGSAVGPATPAAPLPEAWCNFYDSESAKARIGSCTGSQARCEAWIEETKHLEGAHDHTTCQRQDKVWCYRKVFAGPGPVDITNCYPSESTCEHDLRALHEKVIGHMAASESCSLIDASAWVVASEGAELDKYLSDYYPCIQAFDTLPYFALFPPPHMASEQFTLNWCHDKDLPNWKERVDDIRDICSRTVTHEVTRHYMLGALDVLEATLRDYATKVCNPTRVGCWDNRGPGGACPASAWPRLERPSVFR